MLEAIRAREAEQDAAATRSALAALKEAVREYLGEYDTPSKDYAYRALCRDRLRKLVDHKG